MVYERGTWAVALRRLDRALDLILPNPCFACRDRRASRHGLCPSCRSRLRPVPATSCPGCGRRRPQPQAAVRALRGEACARCLVHPPPWDALLAPWSYQRPVDSLIQALKFGHCEVLGPLLGNALAEEVGHRLTDRDLVVPVPLHRWRRLRRGYDQAELIAGALARRLGLPLCRALRRVRSTPPQVGLDRHERRRNVARAFHCPPRQRTVVAGRRVVLVDDVLTTGATAAAGCRALLGAGARSVSVVVVARAARDAGAEG